jgi:hypothetical protein
MSVPAPVAGLRTEKKAELTGGSGGRDGTIDEGKLQPPGQARPTLSPFAP